MATFISSPEEQARKKRAATSPMTSLTQKTIQAKPVTAPMAPLPQKTVQAKPAPAPIKPASTTTIVPRTRTATAPTTTTRNTAVQAPVYGTTNQSGSVGAADAKPIVQPTAPPAVPAATTTSKGDKSNSSVLSMINGDKGDKGGGGGGVSMAPPPYEKKEEPYPPQGEKGDGGVTAQSVFDTERERETSREEAKRRAKELIRLKQKQAEDPLGDELQRDLPKELGGDGGGNGGLDRDEADFVDFEADPDGEANIDGLLEDFVRDGLQGETYDDVTIDADPFKNVTIDADPYKDVNIDYKADREMDKASRANIMKLLGYDEGDTGDEEAYIEKRIADQLGQQLVGSRASMGRAGFGSSGALYGMEGDQMRQANLDAEGRIYDVREREQNQAFDRNMAGAGLADDRDERLYGRSVDDAELDLRNQDERYDRATDQADLDFRNQDEAYARATDQADLDHRNQTTEFGQRMDVAGLDQQGRQGARQDAILKAQMDAINAMFGDGGEGGVSEDGASDPNNPTPGQSPVNDSNRIPVNARTPAARAELAATPEGEYVQGSTYLGSDDRYDYYEGVDGADYKTPRPNPNSADKDELKDAIREGGR